MRDNRRQDDVLPQWAPVGAIAQLGERLLCKQDVVGSIPSGSTTPPGVLTGAEKPFRVRRDRFPSKAIAGAVLLTS